MASKITNLGPALERQRLQHEYDGFIAGAYLPCGDAYEILMSIQLQPHERRWLTDFITRWEAAAAVDGEAFYK